MGCCLSRSAGPNSPYPGSAANASARAINPPPLTLPDSVHSRPRADSHPDQHISPRRARVTDSSPLDQHIDNPLRRHEWLSRKHRWTRQGLDRERRDFFDTRVTGRPEIWQTIHGALRVLWNSDRPGLEDEGDPLSTAQTIISAAEISLPTGDLANGAYDPLGNYYQLPEWIVSDPENMAECSDSDAKSDLGATGQATPGATEGADGEGSAGERKEEKGKAVAGQCEQVALRARLSETGRDVQISIDVSDIVMRVADKVAAEAELPPTKKVRIAYMGRILKDNGTLASQGWQPGHVVNALVFSR